MILTRFIIVDTAAAAPVGTFSISAIIAAAPQCETCATAVPINSNDTLEGSTAGFVNDYANGQGCSGLSSADRVYSVELAAGHAS